MEKPTRHHIFWEQGWYNHALDRAFRSHEALIVPTAPMLHVNLHNKLAAPPKPAEWMMHQLLDVLDMQPAGADPLWGAITCRAYFNDLTHEVADRFTINHAHSIQVHLGRQVALLSLDREVVAA